MATNLKLSEKKVNYRLLLSTRRYLFGALGLSLLTFVLFFLLLFPRIQQVQTHRQELRAYQEQLQSSTEKLSLLQNVNQTQLFQQKEKINALLPTYKPLLPLIGRLEQLSIASNVIVTSFETSPGELSTSSGSLKKESSSARKLVQSNVDSLPLTLKLFGTISDIYRFLEGIDTLVPLADITSISLSSEQGSNPQLVASGSGTVDSSTAFQAELTFQAYYYVGTPPVVSQQALPEVQLRPDLVTKLDTFQLPTPETLENLPTTIIDGGKIDLFQ